jgi:hypothetical protein
MEFRYQRRADLNLQSMDFKYKMADLNLESMAFKYEMADLNLEFMDFKYRIGNWKGIKRLKCLNLVFHM